MCTWNASWCRRGWTQRRVLLVQRRGWLICMQTHKKKQKKTWLINNCKSSARLWNIPTTPKSHLSQLTVLIPASGDSVGRGAASAAQSHRFKDIRLSHHDPKRNPSSTDYDSALMTLCWLGVKWWMKLPGKKFFFFLKVLKLRST